MDPTEKIVHDYLNSQGYTNVQYEPDGNIPPDFLVDGTIAIEVRRLNQNYFDGSNTSGFEEDSIPLWKKLKKLLPTIGPIAGKHSWYVHSRFRRPVDDWNIIKQKVTAALREFIAAPAKEKVAIPVLDNFTLDLHPARKLHTTMFVFVGCDDEDSGGWLIWEMKRNIQYCADEKTRKVNEVRHKYDQWWLLLVDHIGYGLDEFERELFNDDVVIQHDWDRIILIDPRNIARWFEI